MASKYLHIALAFIFFLGTSFASVGQQRCLSIDTNFFKVPDSIHLIPNSIQLQTSKGEAKVFQWKGSVISFSNDNREVLQLCFQYISRTYQLVNAAIPKALYDSGTLFTAKPNLGSVNTTTQEFLGLDGIEIEGAFLRSVSGGQTSGVYMHSALDLQLSGKISDELTLKATLTDQQLPFEPEGNTQRLQDFDRVNIQLTHENWQVTGGDIFATSVPTNSFLKFKRQVQGISVATDKLTFDSLAAYTNVLSSMSKSKVGTQNITAIEGVLGPYRLEGPQGERFIFILAGSEKVYLDGKLLTRGLLADYVIDYNAAELTINAKHYISKFSQIQVEFEYSDQQFSRSLTSMQHKQELGKLRITANYYQESDNINKPFEQLDVEDISQLAAANADLGYGYISSVDTAEFSDSKALYTLKDTIVAENYYEYYSLSNNEDEVLYTVSFSLIGEQKGDYVLSGSNDNYQTFIWVAPIAGVPQGSYVPLRKVVLPQKHQLIELGVTSELKNIGDLSVATTFSEKVFNRFNPAEATSTGKALKLAFQSKEIGDNALNGFKWNYKLNYEYLDSAFIPVQNFRSLSFNRDWGINTDANYQVGEEHLFGAGLALQHKNTRVNYQLNIREKLQNKVGQQHSFNYARTGNIGVSAYYNTLSNYFNEQDIKWDRFSFDLSYNKWGIKPGYEYAYEKHQINLEDSIVNSFQHYDQHLLYLKKEDSTRFSFLISHLFRNDYRPLEGVFKLYEKAQISSFDLSYKYDELSKVNLQLSRKDILQSSEQNLTSDYYQGGLDWTSSLFKNIISHSIYYQTGTGRVLERSYFFQEVALGLGTHSWSDINNNGKKEIEEFFEDETTYGDRNYVKLFNFTNDYQTAFTSLFQSSVQVRMPRSWQGEHSFKGFISKFSGQWYYKVDQKNIFASWKDRINPFVAAENSDELLSARQLMKTNIYFNRGAKWNTQFNWLKSFRKQLLISGFEEAVREKYNFKFFYHPLADWNLNTTYAYATLFNQSDLIESKNFNFRSHGILPELQWQHFKNYRVTVLMEYTTKSPIIDPELDFEITKQRIDFGNKWNQGSIGMLEGHLQYIKLNSTLEEQNSPLAYELLEGLRAGENYVWSLSLRRKIIGDLNLSLNYNGRKSPNTKTRQFGSVQVSALF